MSSLIRVTDKSHNSSKLKAHLVFGVFFICLLLSTYLYPPQYLNGLRFLQESNIFKQVTGFTLLIYMLWQWRLAHTRANNIKHKIKEKIATHKWLGALAPIFILLHATDTGYGYQSVLLITFLGVLVTGLFNYHEFKFNNRWYKQTWMMIHVSLATATMLFLANHIYISYIYT